MGENAGNIRIPDIVVENIVVERLVNGKQWKLMSPRVEHKDGIIYGSSLDITIDEKNGRKTKINAVSAEFTRADNDITMTSADAILSDKDKDYSFSAGELKFDAANEIWSFTNRMTLTDGKIEIEGQSAKYDTKNGDCVITSGGVVKWNE